MEIRSQPSDGRIAGLKPMSAVPEEFDYIAWHKDTGEVLVEGTMAGRNFNDAFGIIYRAMVIARTEPIILEVRRADRFPKLRGPQNVE